jgi:glycosyltransferase involved in cell wall biosynthesis
MSTERGPLGGPRASVVIATYQRASLLPRLIGALEAQTVPSTEFEVVFVDDGSRDGSRELLAQLAAASLLDIRVLGDGVNRRQAAARNIGWRAARAPIVAFTDDDCVPAPDWLAQGLAALGEAHRVVVGRTIPDPGQVHLQGPFSRSITVAHADYFETCNVFYRRRDLEEVGGFDEAFTSHGGEDTDLGWRVRDRGAEPVFLPEALVLHDVKPSDVRAATREALRWTGIPRVVRLHPDARRFLVGRIFWKPSHPLAIGALIGIAAAWRHPATLALAAPWLWYRIKVQPLAPGPKRRMAVLPGALVIDLAEVAAMIRGSIRARTFVL